MSETNTGGPAFPDGSINEWGNANKSGMTLRDYFAAKIMNRYGWGGGYENENAAECYKAADAMLRAREK